MRPVFLLCLLLISAFSMEGARASFDALLTLNLGEVNTEDFLRSSPDDQQPQFYPREWVPFRKTGEASVFYKGNFHLEFQYSEPAPPEKGSDFSSNSDSTVVVLPSDATELKTNTQSRGHFTHIRIAFYSPFKVRRALKILQIMSQKGPTTLIVDKRKTKIAEHPLGYAISYWTVKAADVYVETANRRITLAHLVDRVKAFGRVKDVADAFYAGELFFSGTEECEFNLSKKSAATSDEAKLDSEDTP